MSLILKQEKDDQQIAKEKRDKVKALQIEEIVALVLEVAKREGWPEDEMIRRAAGSAWIAGYHYGSTESYFRELHKKMEMRGDGHGVH